ncbi:MAG: lipoyl synthase [candidate division Zixibacteria bacterium SM23_81]|nr:MAG: lipoyl synthase [candidate division Zixibacteria bacterium SM23_81]
MDPVLQRLPKWLTKPILATSNTRKVAALLSRLQLNTVCQSARCPNKGECFAQGIATFMILGNVCSRNCAFCGVTKGRPNPVDPHEPWRVAWGARELGLRYAVITAVARDDLPDGGAGWFAKTIQALRARSKSPHVEVLVPDFLGDISALARVVEASPDVFNHNVETVPRLYSLLRPQADYRRSLWILDKAKEIDVTMVTKSGIMVGLGERPNEVLTVMRDLRRVGCDVLTVGQYLSPSRQHYPVREFITPQSFKEYHLMAQDLGFLSVYSAPFVRSSYHAEDLFQTLSQRRKGDEDRHHREAFRTH